MLICSTATGNFNPQWIPCSLGKVRTSRGWGLVAPNNNPLQPTHLQTWAERSIQMLSNCTTTWCSSLSLKAGHVTCKIGYIKHLILPRPAQQSLVPCGVVDALHRHKEYSHHLLWWYAFLTALLPANSKQVMGPQYAHLLCTTSQTCAKPSSYTNHFLGTQLFNFLFMFFSFLSSTFVAQIYLLSDQ